MNNEIAYIGLGSNLGDREANLRAAINLLNSQRGVRILRVSPIYETEPVGSVEQGRFLNAVAEVETVLEPRVLLERLLEIERSLGRVRDDGLRWGPRTIDLDLLLYGKSIIDESGLTLPHPRLHERLFVLAPLHDLAPEFTHPQLNRTIEWLWRACADRATSEVVRIADDWVAGTEQTEAGQC